MYEIPIEDFIDETFTEARIASGLRGLLECQHKVSSRVPDALNGTREAVVSAAYAMEEEIHEVVREIGWKPWQEPRPPDVERVIEEYGDLLAFIGLLSLNLAKACDLDPNEFADRVAEQYQRTSENNMRRFENGREQV